jgi:hypothetical protein
MPSWYNRQHKGKHVEQISKYIDPKKALIEHAVYFISGAVGGHSVSSIYRLRYIIKRTTTKKKLPIKEMSYEGEYKFQHGLRRCKNNAKIAHPTEERRDPPSILRRK